MSKDLYIFVHLMKTGGNSFVKQVKLNIEDDESIALLKKKLGKNIVKNKPRLQFIHGHGVPYGIHKYFKKDSKYIIFFRDSLKRTISLYNYRLTRYKKAVKARKDIGEHKKKFLIDNKIPTFKNWLKNKYNKQEFFEGTMYKQLKTLGYIKGNSDKDIKDMFDKFYFIGIVKHLDTDINYLSGKFGFNKFLVKQNISRKFIKDVKDKETLKLLKEKNKEDIKLYKYAVKKREKFVKDNKNYYKLARKTEIKKKILLPFTQVIFDPKGTLIDVSAYLKRKSRLYEKVFDFIRGYEPLDDD